MNDNSPQTAARGSTAGPEILAPAGSRAAFLAALAAGADAVYCGLKQFSARMAAENFSIQELAALTGLAHERDTAVYVAINSLVKSDELDEAGRLLDQLNRHARPDGLIIQDAALLVLARQVGYRGEIHLSTLANLSFPGALQIAGSLPGVTRVVLPRELSIDEIRGMAAECPADLSLEVFVHGALCYAVSGRCYWSSYLGGKSGLRGRCVQPCRRMYEQKGQRQRYFSCQDLWLDVLARLPAEIPQVSALKIEGRKKGPHYVYYTTAAYKLIRDYPQDREMKKTAAEYLDYALGRTGTHYYFLPQRPFSPVGGQEHTGSGMLVGKIQGPRTKPYLAPRIALFRNDLLRIGYEDESWHQTYRINKNVPKKGNLYLRFGEKERPRNGTQVFLIDRREGELDAEIADLEKKLQAISTREPGKSRFRADRPQRAIQQFQPFEMRVGRTLPEKLPESTVHAGVWLTPGEPAPDFSSNYRIWYWLPPVLWPNEEAELSRLLAQALAKRCRNFVLNAPWQIMLFPDDARLRLWAGPFCNVANELCIEMLASMGFSGAVASPELAKADFTRLPARSPLPLGMVISGNWPLCISRAVSEEIVLDTPFSSPKGEQAWVCRIGGNYWVYPNWPIHLPFVQEQMQKIGYRMFVHIEEPVPPAVRIKKRQGLWNWDLGLK
ncbi:MAG TPA: peptidase U32 family protein [Desulfosalsimonadaceae bacterium]|nr:peptidase U32 family protein [Desulfosalsimonadaceae bacterium]